ncbi:MAG: GNAT family N-acetyltransferase, partial [Pirellulaceae bacterium]|nr:GNAT family N-acetyltransferase [Pirellulaceae bacterium]
MNAQLLTIEQLVEYETEWNALADANTPTAPACYVGFLKWWAERHDCRLSMRIAVVFDGGRLIAGLPLIVTRKRGVRVASLPSNEWTSAGDLLIDRATDMQAACLRILQKLRDRRIALCWFEWVRYESPRWSAMAAASRHFLRDELRFQHSTGLVEEANSFDDYSRRLTKNARKKIRKAARQLSEMGEVRVERHNNFALSSHRDTLVRRAFELEDRGWKGAAGSSAIQSGKLDLFIEKAAQFDASNSFELWFLQLNDRPIAFDYGCRWKGTYFSEKVGYDPEFHRFGPGHYLTYKMVEAMHADDAWRAIDTLGVLSEASARWSTT